MEGKKLQAIILVISLLLIGYGLYQICAGNADSLFKLRSSTMSRTNVPFVAIFILVIPVAFYSAVNLTRKK